MRNRDLHKRIATLLLTFMVTISMCGASFEAVFANEGADGGQEVTSGQESGGDAAGEETGSGSGEAGSGTEGTGDGTGDSGGTDVTGPEGTDGGSGDGEDVSGGTDGSEEGTGEQGEGEEAAEGEEELPEEVLPEEEEEIIPDFHDDSLFRNLSDRTISPSKVKAGGNVLELRALTGEGHAGYAVVQGACSDGVYAYYLMVSSYTQKGRVLKVRLSDNTKAGISGILDICHGNGMTYDWKRHALVVVGRESRKQELTVIDADSMKITRRQNVKYNNFKGAKTGLTSSHQKNGLAAIAYNSKYDCYITLERESHDLIVFDPDSFEAVAYIQTTITAKYPGVYQAMDCDDQFVYLVLSSDGNKQTSNVIVALDWNSEKLAPLISDEPDHPTFIKDPWKCGDKKDGKPDAAIKVKSPHEAESIFHVTGADGKRHFYLAEYYNDPVYKYVNKKVKYKVKWKKVKKKVKWKRVKKKGKWKWKYKTKKVWKYKTKYKTKKVKTVSYYQRHNYVYDLGIF